MHKSGSDGKFTSSIGFVLAAVGSAVGMANIWLFPYRVGQYGGGAFLIPYFLFVALFSYVGLSGEFALGRLTGTGAMGSLDYVLRQRGRRGGRVLGAIPLLGVLGIAIGYSVVVGWVLRYAAGSLTGSVLAGDAQGFFSALAVDFGSIPWHFAAVAVTAAILIFGVASGIEKLSKVMMPAFFILFLIIAVRVAFLPGLFLESLAGMGSWMDLITIYVSPFGALLVAVCIYFVLGMKGIRAELALGRARAPGRLFGITARFYVFLTVAVWILGIAYGGIG